MQNTEEWSLIEQSEYTEAVYESHLLSVTSTGYDQNKQEVQKE